MRDVFEGADYPINSSVDLLLALSNDPGTTPESGELSMAAVEPNTKPGGGEFRDSARRPSATRRDGSGTGASSGRRGADEREVNGTASGPFSYISEKAFAAGPPKVSTGSPLTSWATAFSPTEMSVPLSS